LGGESGAISKGYYDNSGEYFAQAASYLNNYEKLKIYIPNNFESFKYLSKHEILLNPDGADYFIFSLDSKRYQTPDLTCGPLEKSFGPRFDEPVVYIYKCK
jgi:hypothetical protein